MIPVQFREQYRRNEEPGQGKEDVNAQESCERQRLEPVMDEDKQDGHGAQAIKGRNILQPLRNRHGLR
ncbi:hypothetical protein QF031_004072 [Pseudarthrobacter defluvii]|nr:hypothetical protein [Pseudarthrobacter defluvii]